MVHLPVYTVNQKSEFHSYIFGASRIFMVYLEKNQILVSDLAKLLKDFIRDFYFLPKTVDFLDLSPLCHF